MPLIRFQHITAQTEGTGNSAQHARQRPDETELGSASATAQRLKEAPSIHVLFGKVDREASAGLLNPATHVPLRPRIRSEQRRLGEGGVCPSRSRWPLSTKTYKNN